LAASSGVHGEIHRHLDELATLVEVLQGSQADEVQRWRMRAVLAFFSGPARRHHIEEERQVFPTLLASGDIDLRRIVERLREDHAWIELHWLDIQPHLTAAARGAASLDPSALRSAVGEFVKIVRHHMAVEASLPGLME
jgi:hypothetical protein